MRPGLLLLLIGIPGAAMATEDRYGPARRPDPVLVQTASGAAQAGPSSYSGPLLNWSGRQAPSQPVPVGRSAASAPPAVAPARSPAYAPRAPAPAAVASLPTSLYDAAEPVAATPPAPAVPQPAPTVAASAPTVPARVAASSTWGDYRPRAYSVVREYGGTPDRIPAPPPQSAFTGPEISLDPGLLGPSQDNTPPVDDGADDPPVRRPAKDAR